MQAVGDILKGNTSLLSDYILLKSVRQVLINAETVHMDSDAKPDRALDVRFGDYTELGRYGTVKVLVMLPVSSES